MGHGDELMASGMARGARARGKRIAFGDGRRIIWGGHAQMIFRDNPNIALPGDDRADDLEWIGHYKGARLYNRHDHVTDRWIWNYSFRASPGEMYFTKAERAASKRYGRGFVLVEPNVPRQKSCAPNKDWGIPLYQGVVDRLRRRGHKVYQFAYGGKTLSGVTHIRTTSFRDAIAIMSRAILYIGPEGGLHHGAAADKRYAEDGALIAPGIPAVVLFGGFVPPAVTGYATHTNLTGGAEACGSLQPCQHCRDAMSRIKVEEVSEAAMGYLRARAA